MLLQAIKDYTNSLIRTKWIGDKIKRKDHAMINDALTDELCERGILAVDADANIAGLDFNESKKYLLKGVGIYAISDTTAEGAIQSTIDNTKWWVPIIAVSSDEILEGAYVNPSTFVDLVGDPYTPDGNKYYVDVNANKTYRWSGTIYAGLDVGIVLGETSSSAYRGDRGKIAYDHSQNITGDVHRQYAFRVPTQSDASSMSFARDAYYGSPSGPLGGSIDFDSAGAVLGTVVTRWINAATFAAGAEFVCVGGAFEANTLTRITCELVQLSPSPVIEFVFTQNV